MKLTKFKHACLELVKDDTTLLIDPGAFTHDFIMPKKVDAVVITHDHADHLDPTLVQNILKTHPKATLFAHESITSRFADAPTQAVTTGETYTVGALTLQFFGGTHAPINESMPVPPNFGVLVNETFYYPGDSFTVPENVEVATLALPVSAPWLSFDACAKFLISVHPKFAFPTHDQILSDDGHKLIDTMVGNIASSQGIVYKRLDSSSIDL